MADNISRMYWCKFCGKSQHQVMRIVAGPWLSDGTAVAICDECIDVCAGIIADARAKKDDAAKEAEAKS